MSLPSGYSFNNYTLEDFKNEPLDKRLEILATLVNHIPRALTYLSMKDDKIYSNSEELFRDFLSYIGIPLGDFIKNKDNYRDLIPVAKHIYWEYVDDSKPRAGVLTRINLVTRVEIGPNKIGYTLTDFGKEMKGFTSYILKQFAELEINPWDILGSTKESKEKRSPINVIKMINYIIKKYPEMGIIKYIYNNKDKKELSIEGISKELNISEKLVYNNLKKLKELGIIEYDISNKKIYSINIEKLEEAFDKIKDYELTTIEISRELKIAHYSISIHLDKLKKLGLVEYESFYPKKERNIYKVNYQRLDKVLNNIDNIKVIYTSKEAIIKTLEYIKENNLQEITTKDVEKLGYDSNYSGTIIADLRILGIVESRYKSKEKFSIIKPTKRLYELYEKVIEPILEVIENPDEIIRYKDYELSKEDKEKLLELYSGWKRDFGTRKDIILSILKSEQCLSVKEIYEKTKINKITIKKYLSKLKKDEEVLYNEKDDVWCYNLSDKTNS
ncbi:hypothetical protein YN1_7880 [Nanoarchaeota archaeon]